MDFVVERNLLGPLVGSVACVGIDVDLEGHASDGELPELPDVFSRPPLGTKSE